MVDILKSDLVWVEGRCYRVNEPITSCANYEEEDLYDEDVNGEMADEGGDDNFEVIQLENGRHCTSFHISQHYHGSVIGKKAMTKRKIESDTRTEIKIPKMGQDGNITILGPSAANVKMARRRINMIVASTRAKEPPTHFVSIPLNKGSIVDGFKKFKSEILEANVDRGISESKFTSPEKLHLTLCVMCLMDGQERMLASELLSEARNKIIIPRMESRPLLLRVKGVSYMNEDPREVHVLYATLDPDHPDTQRLQDIADELFHYFLNAGLAKPQRNSRESVKLHMTLINSKLAHDEDSHAPRESFDAARILERYAGYEFGAAELKEMHLSQRHVTGDDGYYAATCIVSCTDAGL